MEGRLSNRDYEKQFPSSRTDGALRAIHVAVWFTCSDVREPFVGRGLAFSDEFVSDEAAHRIHALLEDVRHRVG
jgi:hypothetical protein